LPSDSPSSPGAADERELGLTPSDLDFLAVEAARIPFEPAMLAIARLAAATWQIPLDAARQLALAGRQTQPLFESVALKVAVR
jgi:hypothetical protein